MINSDGGDVLNHKFAKVFIQGDVESMKTPELSHGHIWQNTRRQTACETGHLVMVPNA